MRRMFDAAYPPANPPRVDAVAGYIGGNTPNVWTQAEWDAMMRRSGARYKLPIFTRSTGGNPTSDATFCVNWLRSHRVPRGVCVALDFEIRVDATYLRAFDRTIVAAGYKTVVYGSRSFVLQNPRPSGGYWTATWNNVPHLDAGAAITQYGSDVTLGQPYDLNVVADSTPLWDTRGGTAVANLDAEDLAAIETRVRKVLNEGTGFGYRNWGDTNQGLVGKVNGLVNDLNVESVATRQVVRSEAESIRELLQPVAVDPGVLETALADALGEASTDVSIDPAVIQTAVQQALAAARVTDS
jgi:hypothetical protein